VDDGELDNIAHAEYIVSGVVFVVGSVWWLLSERRWVSGVAVLVVYVAIFAAVRAWRLRRAP
jgi:hypothetical protein